MMKFQALEWGSPKNIWGKRASFQHTQPHLDRNQPLVPWISAKRTSELSYGNRQLKVTNYFANVWGSIKFQMYLALSNFILFLDPCVF